MRVRPPSPHHEINDTRQIRISRHTELPHHAYDPAHLSHMQPNVRSREPIDQRIIRVREDVKELEKFYNIEFSQTRKTRLNAFYIEQLDDLLNEPFDSYNQGEKIDFLLLRNWLDRKLRQLDLDKAADKLTEPLLPFAKTAIRLCEDRQKALRIEGQKAALDVHDITKQLLHVKEKIEAGEFDSVNKSTAFRAAKTVTKLRSHLAEWFNFFNGYDPMFTWWVKEPFAKASEESEKYAVTIREALVGIKPGDEDAIVGEPIGKEGLVAELKAEKIAYSPEEVLRIGELEYEWCLKEVKKASNELGYGDGWKAALEYVKDIYVPPGEMTQLARHLSEEAIEYVQRKDKVTIPPLAVECIRMYMMAPERQKVSPFFLGGTSLIVSYPTDTMGHEAKLMSMRGNSIHLSRSTVFHELVPGHHLQFHMKARHRPYRNIFTTPCWIEGWAFYWEMILWDDPDWAMTPENRIGMLFWRMHRCARIMFSLNFHLGKMTPQECIELLVDKVGHERSTAEGEVRRSFNGDYPPLYQAGYMLGALQFHQLRRELVESGKMGEKEFHDRVLRENEMPIEMLRALIEDEELSPDHEASWKFYKGL